MIVLQRSKHTTEMLDTGSTQSKPHSFAEIMTQTRTDDLPSLRQNAAFKNKHAHVILCGDFLSPIKDVEGTLNHLSHSSSGGIVCQVLDPAELDLPYKGRWIFEDDAHDTADIANTENIRAAYNEKIAAHTSAIRAACHKYGLHYVLHNTQTPYQETLQTLFSSIRMGDK